MGRENQNSNFILKPSSSYIFQATFFKLLQSNSYTISKTPYVEFKKKFKYKYFFFEKKEFFKIVVIFYQILKLIHKDLFLLYEVHFLKI